MKKYITIMLFFLLFTNCKNKKNVPQSLKELNKIIPVLKDSAYYYAYFKDYYKKNDTINKEELGYIKKKIGSSRFIYSNNQRFLVISPRTMGEEVIRIYGYKKDSVKYISAIKANFPINTNYDCLWNTHNSYIIVKGEYHAGLSRLSDYYSYNYIYAFEKDSIVILDSITTKHRANNLKDVGMETIVVSSYATVTNWKFISRNCILKEYESGEVYTEPRTDSIIFKPNSKKSSEKKCF